MRWNPELYEQFAGPRLQPGVDLIGRIIDPPDGPIVDLGCGTGALTSLLAETFGSDRITGIDHSPEMLQKAKDRYPALKWQQADIAQWTPLAPVAVIYSNAVLHWLDDHEQLFSHLLDQLVAGGVLAVQMPRNYRAPSYTLLGELAASTRWRGKAVPLRKPVADPEVYHRLLAPLAQSVEIWQTDYQQVLEGDDAVYAYSSSTMLQPVIAEMTGADKDEFCQEYRAALAEAYPVEMDGQTLFSFNRLFVMVRR